ncbi:MAG: class I SAM-dependent methyltransferase [Phycisphaerae bacterium]
MRLLVGKFGAFHKLFWKLNRAFVDSPVLSSIWKAIFERRKLILPRLSASELGLDGGLVSVPGIKQSDYMEDAYLEDLLFILQISKFRNAKRILEVGTYRAKTTYAFFVNCPNAFICSYDIRVVPSDYRNILDASSRVSLRIGSFAESEEQLLAEDLYDFIFIDGSHRLEDVLRDSEIALRILAKRGVIVWHDYRKSGFISPDLQVPEALHLLQKQVKVFCVADTNCAIHFEEPPQICSQLKSLRAFDMAMIAFLCQIWVGSFLR